MKCASKACAANSDYLSVCFDLLADRSAVQFSANAEVQKNRGNLLGQ
jgi:hypothetical protein